MLNKKINLSELWICYWQGNGWNQKLWDNLEKNHTRIIKSEIKNKSTKYEQAKVAKVLIRLQTTVEISTWTVLMDIHKTEHQKLIFKKLIVGE